MSAPRLNTPDADVLIVGAGPVGGALAGLLGRRGISVIVVERETDFYRLPRAAHFDHEIMRIFQELGIADAVAAAARVVEAYEFRNAAGDILVRYDMSGPPAICSISRRWNRRFATHSPPCQTCRCGPVAALSPSARRRGAAWRRSSSTKPARNSA
jgi:3-(3-hydroxy-phenyl)propionate hydroxylase